MKRAAKVDVSQSDRIFLCSEARLWHGVSIKLRHVFFIPSCNHVWGTVIRVLLKTFFRLSMCGCGVNRRSCETRRKPLSRGSIHSAAMMGGHFQTSRITYRIHSLAFRCSGSRTMFPVQGTYKRSILRFFCGQMFFESFVFSTKKLKLSSRALPTVRRLKIKPLTPPIAGERRDSSASSLALGRTDLD